MGMKFSGSGKSHQVSADTIVPDPADPQSLNRYSYSYNNPVKYRDPTGHMAACGITTGDCEAPVRPQYAFSEDFGWFDMSHMHPEAARALIEEVFSAIGTEGIQISRSRPLVHPALMRFQVSYWVSGDISGDQVVGVALGIYMDLERRWENWQGEVLMGNSSFAIEDLPSDYLGFYAGAHNMSSEYALQQLGPMSWSDTGPPDPNLIMPMILPMPWEVRMVENLNTEFQPKVEVDAGVFANIPWPEEMQMSPISADSGLWQYQGGTSSGWWAGWFTAWSP
jgi:hypothetical protein